MESIILSGAWVEWKTPCYTADMEIDEFERQIQQAILAVPERFRAKMQNVAFVVEPGIRPATTNEHGILRRGVLLGLYQGVPYGRRGPWYSGVLPDKITIFQEPIERLAGGDPDRVTEIVASTVHHEIAHYFGMNETEVRKWEHDRRSRKS